jgi:hypothetical protein
LFPIATAVKKCIRIAVNMYGIVQPCIHLRIKLLFVILENFNNSLINSKLLKCLKQISKFRKNVIIIETFDLPRSQNIRIFKILKLFKFWKLKIYYFLSSKLINFRK